MKKKCRIIMLPTGKSKVLKQDDGTLILTYKEETGGSICQAQHLYLCSDDKIKEGDWCIESLNNTLFQVEEIEANVKVHKNAMDFRTPKITTDHLISNIKEIAVRREDCKKVIASTDSDLFQTTDYKEFDLISGDKGSMEARKQLPQIPESFIKQYVKANGEIDEVIVEYEMKADGVIGINTNGGGKAIGITNQRWELKLTDNNEVIISMIKEKMYSRDEVISLCTKAILSVSPNPAKGYVEKWIEENL